jgi:CHAT domain-containing protein
LAEVEAGLAQTGTLPHLTLRLLHAQGQVDQAAGDRLAARQRFAAALDLLEQQRASLPLEEIRTAFLDDKTLFYSDLVLALLEGDVPGAHEVAAAFAVVERARSRTLLERLLVSIDVRPVEVDAALAARREDLRRQLHWLYNQLLGESGSRRVEPAIGRQLERTEAALQALERQGAPLLGQAEPVALADLQRRLGRDQQALVYFFAGDEVLAFVVGRDAAQVVRRVCTVTEVARAQAELRFQIGRAELGQAYLARHAQRLRRAVLHAAGRLYDLLVAPLGPLLTTARWLVVPYGSLHLLPFHALWDGSRFVVETVEVAYSPSASVAVQHRAAGSQDIYRSFAGLAPVDAAIPHAQAEVKTCSSLFAAARPLLGADASRARLREAAGQVDVLHLATHGLFRPDNPFFSALMLADGWLDVREIYRLPLAARLVVLSACESGAGEVWGSDDVIGLARGFLGAGAKYVVASLWNVHDESAVGLMDRFYRALLGRTGDGAAPRPAAALAAAQRSAIATGLHPYYWAPFVAIG